jgi:hypothetical protein
LKAFGERRGSVPKIDVNTARKKSPARRSVSSEGELASLRKPAGKRDEMHRYSNYLKTQLLITIFHNFWAMDVHTARLC